MEKYDEKTAIAKIKAKVSNFYEKLGREITEDTDEARQDLIEEIDEILQNTKIPTKHLIIEKLQIDKEMIETLKKKMSKSKGY